MNKAILCAAIVALCNSCVQKTYLKTVIYELNTKGKTRITQVGIKGSDKPLSWDREQALVPTTDSNLYQTIVTYKTGYKFTEVKFMIDGEMELANQNNRRIVFGDSDTTLYKAVFDIPE